jgi:Helix-turn-helix of DDE superfamily endonuclease
MVCKESMHYETIKNSNAPDFKRLTGVQHATFELMASTLRQSLRDFGRPCKLSREDQLLLTLMYWREYRTQFHIASTYGVSESAVCRTILKIENALMRSGQFRLPGKKARRPADCSFEVILVDATECPIQRPQKSSADITAARRSVTPRKRNALLIRTRL